MFEIPKSIAVEQKRIVIISASLIRPFLLQCFGLLAEAFEREREVLFNSKLYSLQKIICNTIDFRNFADKFHEDCSFVI